MLAENTAASVNHSNILPFLEKVAQDPVLQEKLRKVGEEYPSQVTAKAAELSEEIGLPVTIEELEAVKSVAGAGTGTELSESELEGVAGGVNFKLLADAIKKAALNSIRSEGTSGV